MNRATATPSEQQQLDKAFLESFEHIDPAEAETPRSGTPTDEFVIVDLPKAKSTKNEPSPQMKPTQAAPMAAPVTHHQTAHLSGVSTGSGDPTNEFIDGCTRLYNNTATMLTSLADYIAQEPKYEDGDGDIEMETKQS